MFEVGTSFCQEGVEFLVFSLIREISWLAKVSEDIKVQQALKELFTWWRGRLSFLILLSLIWNIIASAINADVDKI